MESCDFYAILQVDPEADTKAIVAAFRKLARKYHPDRNKSPDATQKMQEINTAFEVLRDPGRRAVYDASRPRPFVPPEPRSDTPPPQREPASVPVDITGPLVHESDFSTRSEKWVEEVAPTHRTYRRDGYYHIAVRSPNWIQYSHPSVWVEKFTVHADAQFVPGSGKGAVCGIVFRLNQRGPEDVYYRLAISQFGHYALHFCDGGWYEPLLNERFSAFLNPGESINSLRISMAGNTIELGINGNFLISMRDDRLAAGYVGLFVATGPGDTYAEARFREYRLYVT